MSGGGRTGAINALWLNHTSLMSGAEESMRAVLARWQSERRGEFRDIDAVAALPGDGPLAQVLRAEGTGVVFAPLRRVSRPAGLFDSASLLAHVWTVAPLVARLLRQTNSHLAHSNSTTAHLIGGIAAARLDIPALWHVRDMVRLGRAAPFLAARATVVIAISGAVAESLAAQGVPPAKIRIIRNGVDLNLWKPNPDAPRRLRHELEWDKYFVFGLVGQMVPWKNARHFVEAAAMICRDEGASRARFAIIGGDLWGEHADYVEELRALIRRENLDERVRLVDFQSDGRDAIASLDCLAHAALDEPLGRVLLESLALGIPTVAYGRGGPLEIVRHEHDGLLAAPSGPQELAAQMRRVLGDADLRAHLSGNGPRTIAERFDIADVARATAAVYRDVAR